MIALGILAGIPGLLVLLLLFPVSVGFDYGDGGPRAGLRYLFFRFDLFPAETAARAEKKAKRAQKKEKRKKEEAKPKGPGAGLDTAKTVWSLLRDSGRGLNLVRKNIVVSDCRILISVGGGDAHQAAERYGRLCAALFPALGALGRYVTLREPALYIAPNFLSAETVAEISFRLRVTPLIVLVAAADIFIKFVKSVTANKRKRQKAKGRGRNSKTNDKGGNRNESAASAQ